jgi:hypothetical protein
MDGVKAALKRMRFHRNLTSLRLVTLGSVFSRCFFILVLVAGFLALTAQHDQNTSGQDKYEQEEKYGRHYEK